MTYTYYWFVDYYDSTLLLLHILDYITFKSRILAIDQLFALHKFMHLFYINGCCLPIETQSVRF